VKAGELLAEIDTPEIDDQLQQARADLATAEANYRLAESSNIRWEALLKTDSVSKQEVDERSSAFAARKAALEAARFNVARLQKLQAFKRLHAPFDGVITARNTDVGALIDAGSSGAGRELFHLASTHRLRVYVNVPQAYAAEAVPGVEAELTLDVDRGLEQCERFDALAARERRQPLLEDLLRRTHQHAHLRSRVPRSRRISSAGRVADQGDFRGTGDGMVIRGSRGGAAVDLSGSRSR